MKLTQCPSCGAEFKTPADVQREHAGAKGGRARHAKLSQERRTAIARDAARKRWDTAKDAKP